MPLVVERRHERVPCPAEVLTAASGVSSGGAGRGREHGLQNQTVLHLKAANRAPSHQFALGVLHDCLTAAEAASLRAEPGGGVGGALRALRAQMLWSRGLE